MGATSEFLDGKTPPHGVDNAYRPRGWLKLADNILPHGVDNCGPPVGATSKFIYGSTPWGWRFVSPMGYKQYGKGMSTRVADMLSTPWNNRGDLAFCQPHGSYVLSTPWGRVQQQCASRYVHPIGRGTGESVNSMGPGSQRVLIGVLLVQTGLIFPFSSWPLALCGPVPIF